MMMNAPTLDTHDGTIRCPTAACERQVACDACMHTHLLRRHGRRYGEVFGRVDEAFLHFCEGHRGVSPGTLGLYSA